MARITTNCDRGLVPVTFTAHDRIIYDIYDETLVVLVIETEGHYNDK